MSLVCHKHISIIIGKHDRRQRRVCAVQPKRDHPGDTHQSKSIVCLVYQHKELWVGIALEPIGILQICPPVVLLLKRDNQFWWLYLGKG